MFVALADSARVACEAQEFSVFAMLLARTIVHAINTSLVQSEKRVVNENMKAPL